MLSTGVLEYYSRALLVLYYILNFKSMGVHSLREYSDMFIYLHVYV